METYISLLRAINVGGHQSIRMDQLQVCYEIAGFKNIKSYLQSGNVIFKSSVADESRLEQIIKEEIRKKFGFEIEVFVRTGGNFRMISESNPFLTDRHEDISRLYVTFVSGKPSADDIARIQGQQYFPDEYFIRGNEIFLFCPNGYGRTKLSNTFFESKLKMTATTRNWNTVMNLLSIAKNH